MAQALIDKRNERFPCKYCSSTFKSEAGHINHMNRIHPLDVKSGLHCFTCNKAFTKREVLHQHYQTVRHQINCKRLQDPEIEEQRENPPSNIREAIQQYKQPMQKRSYRSLLMETTPPKLKKIEQTPVQYLRTEPAIIPLESTVAQSDPRKALHVSFTDLVDSYTEQPNTEKSENPQQFKEKDEDFKNNNRTVSRGTGHTHESQENSQTNKEEHYRKIDRPDDMKKEFIEVVKNTLDKAKSKELIDEDTHKILYRSNPRTSNLYLLPKIHKTNNPGRPIINSVGSLTETLSAFVDEILRKYAKKVRSYVKDTTHFLQLTKDLQVEENEYLCTVDVTALYTNIPHKDGIKRVLRFMEQHQATQTELTLVRYLLKLILRMNYFEFNNQTYLQVSGTAMGTRCAPNYAIIFMGDLEQEFLDRCEKKPRVWYRFIDDIFMIWNHGRQDLDTFLEELNEHHSTIKFTIDISEYGLAFLDTFIYKEDGILKTRVYHKPTDNKQYLLYTSCHPLQQKNSIPYSLLIRARRICTKESEFIQEAKSIIKTLRQRKYPEEILTKAVKRILEVKREELLIPKTKEEDNRIRYITTFNPLNPPMRKIICQHVHMLGKMRRNPILPHQIQTVYRKSSNLRNLLISGIITPKKKQPYRSIACKETSKKTCMTCERITYTNTVTSFDNITLPIRGQFNCQSTNCIYSLTCHCCGKKYIGESSQTVNLRMRGHESHIKYYQKHPNNPVAQHFGINTLTPKEYNLEILDQEQDKNKRNRLEESWIFLLNTLTPNGLNTKW